MIRSISARSTIRSYLAHRRLDRDQPAFAVDRHVHEDIEPSRDVVGSDTVWLQRLGEIAETAAMDGLVRIEMLESRGRAG